jgi:cellulose synthase/poly-beta-1,6-N-acetylglucosamine synthase-like glycosyltransferase
MPDILFAVIGVIYLIVIILLFAYGLNYYYLIYLTLKNKNINPEKPPEPDEWPKVTVQLPIYNEMYVAERLINAAAGLHYPADRLEIQVLDDSTDETVDIAADVIRKIQQQGVNIVHVRRPERTGYKAGALAHGLDIAYGEFIAIFDADFIPSPDFLLNTIPYFQYADVSFIQTRWGHVNRDYSLLTRLQAYMIDVHFSIEQFARSRGGYWFNFNGTAGVWRKAAIQDAGGWSGDTLTEDLDLSYRTIFKGWRGIYLRHIEVPAELPDNFNAIRRQQHRWARGSIECAVKFMSQVWRTQAPLPVKLLSTIHLTGYFVHLYMFILAILYPLMVKFPAWITDPGTLAYLGMIFNVTAFAPSFLFLVSQHQLGRRWWRVIPLLPLLSAFGAGLMLNTVKAALGVVNGKESVFERTPKFGLVGKRGIMTKRNYRLGLTPIVYFEITFAIFNLATVILAIMNRSWIIAFYATFFMIGLFYSASSSVTQAVASRFSH